MASSAASSRAAASRTRGGETESRRSRPARPAGPGPERVAGIGCASGFLVSTVQRLGCWAWQRIRRSNMSWSSKSVDFITLFSENLERSKAFYQDVFGLRLIFEDENSAVFRLANTGINLLRAEAAGELVSPGAVASRDAGARLVFTIGVDDVDAVCAELAAHDVELLNGPVNRPWGVRTASFTDPG